MPENVSLEKCIESGIDIVDELTRHGTFCGDLAGSILENLKKNYPEMDGKADRIARSLYWALTCDSDSPIESSFWILSSPCKSVYPISHEYVRKGEFDRNKILKRIAEKYLDYIQP